MINPESFVKSDVLEGISKSFKETKPESFVRSDVLVGTSSTSALPSNLESTCDLVYTVEASALPSISAATR